MADVAMGGVVCAGSIRWLCIVLIAAAFMRSFHASHEKSYASYMLA